MDGKRIVVRQEVKYNTNGITECTISLGHAEVSIYDIPPPRPLSDYTNEELMDEYTDMASQDDPDYHELNIDEVRAEITRRMKEEFIDREIEKESRRLYGV